MTSDNERAVVALSTGHIGGRVEVPLHACSTVTNPSTARLRLPDRLHDRAGFASEHHDVMIKDRCCLKAGRPTCRLPRRLIDLASLAEAAGHSPPLCGSRGEEKPRSSAPLVRASSGGYASL